MDSAAIWDLDGTLADTEQGHYTAWKRLCAEYDRGLTWDEFKPTFGLGNHDILHMLIDPALSAVEVEVLSARKEGYYRESTGGVIEAMPGARPLVAHFESIGVRQAIGSSAPPENIEFILKALGYEDVFEVIVSRWQVERGKPHPDIFLRAAQLLHVPAANCVVLEDAPAGVQAAEAAGMRSVALVSTWPEDMVKDATVVVRDLSTICWPRTEWDVFVRTGNVPAGNR